MKLLPQVEPRHRVLFYPMLASFVLFGLNLAVTGAVVPKIVRDFRWSYTATGVVLAAGSVGYFVSTFLCGVLVRHFGPRRVIAGGLLVQAAGLSLFAATPSVAFNVLTKLLVGGGAGGTEVVVNYAVLRMERAGHSRLMNLMHAAFSVGAILSPLALEGLVALGAGWRLMFRLMAGVAVGMAVLMALLPFRRLRDGDEAAGDEPPILELLRRPLLILCFLILLVYVGAEVGVSSWVGEYYVAVLNAPPRAGSMMVSIFWGGLLAGRLGVSIAYHGTHHVRLLTALGLLCTAALPAALWTGSPWAAGAGFFLTGVGYSAVYPLVMSMVGRHFARGQSVAVGFAGAGGAIGALVIPFAVAAAADRVGLHGAFFLYVAINGVLLGLVLAVIPFVRKARGLGGAGKRAARKRAR